MLKSKIRTQLKGAVLDWLPARYFRLALNLWPCYWGTGARVIHIADDWTQASVTLPLSFRTRNYVGVIFGGSIFSCVDPLFMILMMKLMGLDYVVWDKAAQVRFRKPGRSTLRATLKIPEGEPALVRKLLETENSVDRTYSIELKDGLGQVCAEIQRVVYFSTKSHYMKTKGASETPQQATK